MAGNQNPAFAKPTVVYTIGTLTADAVTVMLQTAKAVSAGTGSHLAALQTMGVLPVAADFMKTLHKGALRIQPPAVQDVPLHQRLVLPPDALFSLFEPLSQTPPLEVSDAHFFVCLALATGHHCGESFFWQPGFYAPESTLLYHPAFKFHGDVFVPAAGVYKLLHEYVLTHKQAWLSAYAPPARRVWRSAAALGAAVAAELRGLLPPPPPSGENWTHRILRRSMASVLHAIGAPQPLIERQLIHQSDGAVDSYVVLYSDAEKQDLTYFRPCWRCV